MKSFRAAEGLPVLGWFCPIKVTVLYMIFLVVGKSSYTILQILRDGFGDCDDL
jgi:hypothetical protein